MRRLDCSARGGAFGRSRLACQTSATTVVCPPSKEHLSAVIAHGDSLGCFQMRSSRGVEVHRERPEDCPRASVRAVGCSIFRKVALVVGVGDQS